MLINTSKIDNYTKTINRNTIHFTGQKTKMTD